ncbi:MAG: HEAT repeat domain-containing protein [Myxococcaceae bacterium]|nr:HEAT repeat domain-containing protein [Myxococcaceae bacterium]
MTRFGVFEGVTSEVAQKELLAMGKPAVPALLGALRDKTHGWTAARVLGQLGLSTPEVIAALRKRGDELWFSMALGMLGDHDWLAKQAPLTAVRGLTARLKAITRGGPPRPLDYRPLEGWLETNPKERKRVEDELAPGRSYVRIEKSDVDEALRALGSPFAVVRWHAASVLGDRRLRSARVILPRLVALFDDRSALVRRLAVLSVTRWKAAAKGHLPAIRALKHDTDPVVRSIAEER